MHITEIHKTSYNQGCLVVRIDISSEKIDDLNEKQFLFDLRIKTSEMVIRKFPEHFKDISVTSDPAIENCTITCYVNVTENVENALLDTANELGLELGKTAV